MPRYKIAAFYRFTPLEELEIKRARLLTALQAAGVRGSVLLAFEGLNGAIAGLSRGVDAGLDALREVPGCGDLTPRISWSDAPPFPRLKVRLKREIVRLGEPAPEPRERVGTYVDPADWNAVMDDPDVLTIDTRNAYEVRLGSFDGAVDPGTEAFGDFPAWFRAERAAGRVPKKVAMFCTGGIRCEKATAFLKAEGVDDVYHLKGGILNYLETVPEADSRFRGECYVFDERVSVTHGLLPGRYALCRACGEPVAPEDRNHESYRPGVSCPACRGRYDADRRARFAERQRQIELAKARGERHLAARK